MMEELTDIQLFDFDEESHENCVNFLRVVASVVIVDKLFQNEKDLCSQESFDKQKRILNIIYNHMREYPGSFSKKNLETMDFLSNRSKKLSSKSENAKVHEAVRQIAAMEKKDNEISYLQNRNEQMSKMIKILQNTVLNGHERVEDLNSNIFKLQKEMFDLKEQTELQKFTLEDVLDDRIRIRNDFSYKNKKMEEKIQKEIKEKENLGTIIGQLQGDMDKLYGSLSKRSLEIKDLNKKIEERDRIIGESVARIDEQQKTLEHEREEFSEELESMKSENEELVRDVLSLEAHQAALTQKINQEARDREGLEGQVNVLRQTLEDRDFIATQQKELIDNLEKETRQKSRENESLVEENRKMNGKLNSMKEENNVLTEKNEGLESSMHVLEERVQKWVKIHEMDSRIKDKMKNRLQKSTEATKVLEIEKKDLTDSLRETEDKVKKIEKEISRITKLEKDLKSERISKLRILEKCEDQSDEIRRLKHRNCLLKEKQNQQLTRLHTLRVGREVRISKLESELRDIRLSQSKVQMDREFFEKMYRSQCEKTEKVEKEQLTTLERFRSTLNHLSVCKKEMIVLLGFKKKYEEWLMKRKIILEEREKKKQQQQHKQPPPPENDNKRRLLRKNKSLNRLYYNPMKKRDNGGRGKNNSNNKENELSQWMDEMQLSKKKFNGMVKFSSFGGNSAVDPTDLNKMGWNL